jgi:hypothetical protein
MVVLACQVMVRRFFGGVYSPNGRRLIGSTVGLAFAKKTGPLRLWRCSRVHRLPTIREHRYVVFVFRFARGAAGSPSLSLWPRLIRCAAFVGCRPAGF